MFRKDLIALSLAAMIACGAVTPAMAMESGAETMEMTETAVEPAEEEADGSENEEAEEITTAAVETQEAGPEEDAEDTSLADQSA